MVIVFLAYFEPQLHLNMKKNKDSIILGIESSCDDTSAAILKNGVLLSNII